MLLYRVSPELLTRDCDKICRVCRFHVHFFLFVIHPLIFAVNRFAPSNQLSRKLLSYSLPTLASKVEKLITMSRFFAVAENIVLTLRVGQIHLLHYY